MSQPVYWASSSHVIMIKMDEPSNQANLQLRNIRSKSILSKIQLGKRASTLHVIPKLNRPSHRARPLAGLEKEKA